MIIGGQNVELEKTPGGRIVKLIKEDGTILRFTKDQAETELKNASVWQHIMKAVYALHTLGDEHPVTRGKS